MATLAKPLFVQVLPRADSPRAVSIQHALGALTEGLVLLADLLLNRPALRGFSTILDIMSTFPTVIALALRTFLTLMVRVDLFAVPADVLMSRAFSSKMPRFIALEAGVALILISWPPRRRL